MQPHLTSAAFDLKEEKFDLALATAAVSPGSTPDSLPKIYPLTADFLVHYDTNSSTAANQGAVTSSEEGKENKMAYVPLYMNKVNGWEKVNTSVSANPIDLGHLLNHNGELGTKAARMRLLSAEQAMLNARKQAISVEMQGLLREGQTLLDYIQTGVRQHYGLGSEKLVEFGLRPIRSKSRPEKEVPPPPGTESVAPDTAQ